LLNISFVGNYATRLGSRVMTVDPEGVLFSCNYSNTKNDFIGRDQLRSLSVIRPNSACTSWETIQYPDGIMRGVVATSGVQMNLSTSAGEPQITHYNDSNLMVLNFKRRAQLPVIRVSVLDVYGNGPVPTISSFFDAVMLLPRELFPRNISTTVADGFAEFSSISSVRPPGNYTLHIQPSEASLAPITLIVRILECEVGDELTDGGEICRKCGNAAYNFYPISGNCTACPPDATCEGRYITPKEGYWHESPCHAEVLRCLNDEACQYEDRQQKITNFIETFPGCKTNDTFDMSYDEVLCRPVFSY